MSDIYPGDADYTAIVQEIYKGADGRGGVTGDAIAFPKRGDGRTWTRPEVVDQLLARLHETRTLGSRRTSCHAFLGSPAITRDGILHSLYFHTGHPTARGWNDWRGLHDGAWHVDDGRTIPDAAVWHDARDEGRHAPSGSPYHLQPVSFLEAPGSREVERDGWNQSHPDVQYLWGWDPKSEPAPSRRGTLGAHLGFRHEQGGVDWIVWFTNTECFLEGIATVGTERRRVSVGFGQRPGFDGRGLWTVDHAVTRVADVPVGGRSGGRTGTVTQGLRRHPGPSPFLARVLRRLGRGG